MEPVTEALRKIQMEKYAEKLFLNVPPDVTMPQDVEADRSIQKSQYDLILVFVFSLEQMEEYLEEMAVKDMLRPGGYLYFTYPKKGNKKYKEYMGRDSIFTLPIDKETGYYKDSKLMLSRMVSFDETFTLAGFKCTPQKKARPTAAASQRVADYEDKVPQLLAYWQRDAEVQKKLEALTPGYQKGWAQYIYSARAEATRQKRLEEMAEVLRQGYKSIELYRQAAKEKSE